MPPNVSWCLRSILYENKKAYGMQTASFSTSRKSSDSLSVIVFFFCTTSNTVSEATYINLISCFPWVPYVTWVRSSSLTQRKREMGDRERQWKREIQKKIERLQRGVLWVLNEEPEVSGLVWSILSEPAFISGRQSSKTIMHLFWVLRISKEASWHPSSQRTKLRGFYYIVHRIQEHKVIQSALCCYSYNVHIHRTHDSIVRHHLQTLFTILLTYQTFNMLQYIQVNAHILLSGSIISSKPKRHIYQTQTPGSKQPWKPQGKKGYYEFVILEKHRDMLCYSRHFPSSKGHGQCPKSLIASFIPYDNLSDG